MQRHKCIEKFVIEIFRAFGTSQKKSNFTGFSDKFVEKTADFMGNSQKFSGQILLKNNW